MAYQGQTQSSPAVTSKYFQDDGQSGDTPAAAIDPGGARTRLGDTTDAAAPVGNENAGVIALIKGVLTKLPSLISGRIPVDASGATISSQITDGSTNASVRDLPTNDALNVAIVDGSGNQITTFGGTGGTSNSDQDAFTPATTLGTPIMGSSTTSSIGANQVGIAAMSVQRSLHVELRSGSASVDPATETTLGTLGTEATLSNVNVDTNAISAKLDNQATSANQDTANTSLASIDTKVTDNATATNQTTGNASLSSIDAKLTDNATNTTLQALVDLITPETPFTDQKALVTTSAEVLSSVSRPSKVNITVAAPSTNANPVYVGPSGVTVGTGDIVEPGQRLVLTGYTNANQVFCIDGVGGSANKLTFSGS